MRLEPRSTAGQVWRLEAFLLALGCVVLLVAVAAAAFASPVVDPFDLQRRDRGLSTAERFVAHAYWFLLNRLPDRSGLATYRPLYEEQGPQAVAEAIISSPEFNGNRSNNHWVAALSPASRHDALETAVPALAREYVAFYDRGGNRLPGQDLAGRVGFVVIVLAGLLLIGLVHRQAAKPGPPPERYGFLPASLITGLFAAVALTWLLYDQFTLGAFGAGHFGFLEWVYRLNSLAIVQGVANVWTPYPQGTQLLLIALTSIAERLGSQASEVWTAYTIFRLLFHVVFLLVPSVASVYLVYRLGAIFSPTTATLAALVIGFSFASLYYGGSGGPLSVTDPLPAAVTIAAVWALISGRSTVAGVAIGLGTTLKLLPVLLLPVALLAAPDPARRLRTVGIAALTIAAVFGPLAVANWEMFLSPWRWQSSRPAWESWYAFANWLVNAPHEFTGPQFEDISLGYSYGWVFWGLTPPLSVLLAPVPSGPPGWENLVSLAGTVGTLLVCLGARLRSPRALARWSLYCLAGFLFWNIGWSPQYELYLLPFLLLTFPNPAVGVAAAIVLESLTFLEYPLLLPWAYYYGGPIVWVLWAILFVRYLLLAWLCIWIVVQERALATLADRLARLWARFALPHRRAQLSDGQALGFWSRTGAHAIMIGYGTSAAIPLVARFSAAVAGWSQRVGLRSMAAAELVSRASLLMARGSCWALLILAPTGQRWTVLTRPVVVYPEFGGGVVFLIDVLLATAVFCWSLHRAATPAAEFRTGPKLLTTSLAALVLLGSLSVLWSEAPFVSAGQSVRLLLLLGLYLFLLNGGLPARAAVVALVVGAVAQAALGLVQFASQGPIGVPLVHEFQLAPATPGAVTFWTDERQWARAYGLATSPNILGGYLVVGLLLLLCVLMVSRSRRWFWGVPLYALGLAGLLATFSRSAWLGLFAGAGILAVSILQHKPSRGLAVRRFPGVASTTVLVIVLFATAAPGALPVRIGWPNAEQPSGPSAEGLAVDERVQYFDVALRLMGERPLLGVGLGAFPLASFKFLGGAPPEEHYRFQPVHNVPVLIVTELGPAAAPLLLLLLIACLRAIRLGWARPPRPWAAVLAALGVTALFDHYPWSVPQGQVLAWASIGLLAATQDKRLPAQAVQVFTQVGQRARWQRAGKLLKWWSALALVSWSRALAVVATQPDDWLA